MVDCARRSLVFWLYFPVILLWICHNSILLAVFRVLGFPMGSYCCFKDVKQTHYLGHILCDRFIPFMRKTIVCKKKKKKEIVKHGLAARAKHDDGSRCSTSFSVQLCQQRSLQSSQALVSAAVCLLGSLTVGPAFLYVGKEQIGFAIT